MKRLGLVAVVLLGGAIAGCGGGGAGGRTVPAVGSPIDSSNANVPPKLAIANWGQGVLQGATYVRPASNVNMSITVQVHQQNATGLVRYAEMANTPGSPYFRKWLTPQQIGQTYGASASDYQTVATYFQKNGIAVTGWQQRLVLVVSGSETQMQKAFNTTFGIYQRDNKEFIAPMTPPHFSQALPVDSIARIANFKPEHTYMIPSGPRAGAGYSSGFSPSTVRAAFDYIGAYNAGYNGTGVTLGIIGTGAIDTQAAAPGDVDLAAFATDTNTAQVATVTEHLVTNAGVNSGLSQSKIGAGSFPYSPTFTSTPAPPWGFQNEDGESQLDTQQAAALAPDANVYFYLGYNATDGCSSASFSSPCSSGNPCPPTTNAPTYGCPEWGIQETDSEIQQAISDNTVDVVSMSFGGGEIQQGFSCNTGCSSPFQGSYAQLEYAALNAEGIAAFAASGDEGSAECFQGQYYLPEQCVSYPAGDPNVTSVGGITTNVDLTGAITAPWLAWGISTSDNGYGGQQGSGGGTAQFLPAPAWQTSDLSGSPSLREQPDVSLDGDPSTGVSVVENGSLSGIGGTSVATPEMAAMWADVLSACEANPGVGACPASGSGHWWRMGNASQYLYAIYAQKKIASWTPSLTYAQTFYDIVYGDNEMYASPGPAGSPVPSTPVPGYAAGPGYDEVTGIGVPFAGHLIEGILGHTSGVL